MDIDDAPVEKAKGRGLIAAIKDFFTGKPEEKPEPAKVVKEEAAPKPSGGSRTVRGRVTVHRAGLLVIEIVAEGEPLAWDPAEAATVMLATGHHFIAKRDAGRTTRAGTVAAGATARLALELPAGEPVDAVLSVTIALGGDIVIIEV